MNYYVCDYKTQRAIAGPYQNAEDVVDIINRQPVRANYCQMSRHMLAKNGIYPNTKAGNKALQADLLLAQESGKARRLEARP